MVKSGTWTRSAIYLSRRWASCAFTSGPITLSYTEAFTRIGRFTRYSSIVSRRFRTRRSMKFACGACVLTRNCAHSLGEFARIDNRITAATIDYRHERAEVESLIYVMGGNTRPDPLRR